jgi:hypothetical protein
VSSDRPATREPGQGRSLRDQSDDERPIELVNADGSFCGCMLYPSGSVQDDLLAIAEHAAPGNCPREIRATE